MMKKKSLEWLNCSEEELALKMGEWVQEKGGASFFKNSILFLEGEMGAGKSTFARLLLSELVEGFSSQGSPTFPLVQEYRARDGFTVYHIDLYRLKHEAELEDSGILQQIEEPGVLAIVEWASLFPDSFSYWRAPAARIGARPKSVMEVSISPGDSNDRRSIRSNCPI